MINSFLNGITEAPQVDPTQALLELISWKYAEVEWLRVKVQGIEDGALTWGEVEYAASTGFESGTRRVERTGPHAYVAWYHRAQDQLATYTAKAISAGIEERRIRISEQIGHTVSNVLRAIANDVATALMQAGLEGRTIDLFRSLFDDAAHRNLRALRTTPTQPKVIESKVVKP